MGILTIPSNQALSQEKKSSENESFFKKKWVSIALITALFFRVIHFVLPTAITHRFEILWGHLRGAYLNWKVSKVKDDLTKQVDALSKKNSQLIHENKTLSDHQTADQKEIEARHTQQFFEKTSENKALLEQIDQLRTERKEDASRIEELENLRKNLLSEKESLEGAIKKLSEIKTILEKEKNDLTEERARLIQSETETKAQLEQLEERVRAEEFYQELNLNLQKLFDEMNSMLTEEERTREISRATFSGMMPLYIQHTKAYTESLKETMKSPELTLGAKATLQTNAQGLDRVVAHLEAIGKVVELMEKIFHSLQYSPPYHTPPSYAATNRNLIG